MLPYYFFNLFQINNALISIVWLQIEWSIALLKVSSGRKFCYNQSKPSPPYLLRLIVQPSNPYACSAICFSALKKRNLFYTFPCCLWTCSTLFLFSVLSRSYSYICDCKQWQRMLCTLTVIPRYYFSALTSHLTALERMRQNASVCAKLVDQTRLLINALHI